MFLTPWSLVGHHLILAEPWRDYDCIRWKARFTNILYTFADRKKSHTAAENSGKLCVLQSSIETRGAASAGILSSGKETYQFFKTKVPRFFERSGYT